MAKIINFLKKWSAKKQYEKCQRMNSEIICAIVHQVEEEQKNQAVTIPAFQEIQQRYDNLQLKNYQDVRNAYTVFFNKGLVSGIEL